MEDVIIIIIMFVVLYYIIKWAVRNGINESELGKTLLKRRVTKNDEK